MKETPFNTDFEEKGDPFAIKETLFKYLKYWSWYMASAFIALIFGYMYIQTLPTAYRTVAKIKIVDDSKEMDVVTNALTFMSNTSINLENEIEVLRSYRLLSQVVNDLKLNIGVFKEGIFSNKRIYSPPFIITPQQELDTLSSILSYSIEINSSNFKITDENGEGFTAEFNQPEGRSIGLPFGIILKDSSSIDRYNGETYSVIIFPIKEAVINLSKKLEVNATNKNSDILSLSLDGENSKWSENILNKIITNFDQDGILDRQLVSRRTLEVIDKRFVYLSGELDSIEVGKQDFKEANKLSYIQADAGQALQKKSDTEDEVFQLEAQISLTQMLKNTVVSQAEYSLLPADVGLENSSLNALVYDYNQLALKRDKLITSVGVNHPLLLELSGQLERGKLNILKTVNVYQAQLNASLSKLNKEKSSTGELFSKLPEKEKMLRSIERQQSIKENLFLLLLQKREEAAINLAVTAPSIKVIDYGLTGKNPVSPNKKLIYAFSLLLGLFAPLLVLFIRFTLDTKVHDRSDIEKMNTDIPIVAEVPLLKDKKNFDGPNDNSILAELFRIGGTNVNYMLPKKENGKGQVVFVTSGVKGEGKTLVAYNLSLAYASIKKRVLLIGADLRSPALSENFDSKGKIGLTDYLSDSTLDWKSCVYDSKKNMQFHKVCISGSIPLNSAELLSSNRFESFIEEAKKEFDYIIVDTAPTLLVTDTLLISECADVSLFVIRAGLTDKRIVEYASNLNKTKKFTNMAFVLNDVSLSNSKNYGYGYGNDESFSNNEYSRSFVFFVSKISNIFKVIKLKFSNFFKKSK